MIDVDALALQVLALAAPHMSLSDRMAFDLDRAGDADAAVADALRVVVRSGQPISADLRNDLREFVAQCPDSSGAQFCAGYLAKVGTAA